MSASMCAKKIKTILKRSDKSCRVFIFHGTEDRSVDPDHAPNSEEFYQSFMAKDQVGNFYIFCKKSGLCACGKSECIH